jgi:hypothetical protein
MCKLRTRNNGDDAKSNAGWSCFRHNLTEARVEDLPPGKGAAAAMLLTANASRAANATWTRRVRDADEQQLQAVLSAMTVPLIYRNQSCAGRQCCWQSSQLVGICLVPQQTALHIWEATTH